jgi:hypothetical protein
MATPVGVNELTTVVDRYLASEVTDTVYSSNPLTYRWMTGDAKRIVKGGLQLEAPLRTSRPTAGGWFSDLDVLTTAQSDTKKTLAWDWKQLFVPVAISGLTLIKVDSPRALYNYVAEKWDEAKMEIAELLAVGLYGDSNINAKAPDGIATVTAQSGVYGGVTRSTLPGALLSKVDVTSATLTLPKLQSMFSGTSKGGYHPTIILSRQEQFDRYLNLGQAMVSLSPDIHAMRDDNMFNAGFNNLSYNGVPWVVDPHVANGAGGALNSEILFLTESVFKLYVSERADFYMEDFQTAINQNAAVSKLYWAGNLACTYPALQGKMTNISLPVL